jgi:hypothetical protein
MDAAEARELLGTALNQYRSETYASLKGKVGFRETKVIVGDSGQRYRIEMQVIWDGRPNETIRVFGSIDDGGLRAILPLREDFLVDQV